MEDFREDINRVPSCNIFLTEVAGEGGTDWAPQKFLSSQQFRHLMRSTKHVNKICLPCLVPEIQLFVYIFGRNSKWPPEVQKGSPVKFFVVSYYKKLLKIHKSKDRGSIKILYPNF